LQRKTRSSGSIITLAWKERLLTPAPPKERVAKKLLARGSVFASRMRICSEKWD